MIVDMKDAGFGLLGHGSGWWVVDPAYPQKGWKRFFLSGRLFPVGPDFVGNFVDTETRKEHYRAQA